MSEAQNIADYLEQAVLKLQSTQSGGARLDARLLLQHVLGITHEQLLLKKQSVMPPEACSEYHALIERRYSGEPIAKIIGKKAFWKSDFITNAHTLDPRPDSETLIELVLETLSPNKAPSNILDFGTGTGCLLLSLLGEYKKANGLGVDISPQALEVAERNARDLMLHDRAQFIQSEWGEQISGEFDVIISNPPYIEREAIQKLARDVREFDPMSALDGGEDGYDDYRKLAPYCAQLLTAKGVVFFEIGQGQEQKVESIMAQHGFYLVASKKDIAGIIRALAFQT